MKRTIFLVLILCAVLFALSACGSSSEKESNASSEASQTTTSSVATEGTANNDEKLQKYLSACELLLAGNTAQAYSLFKEISDYAPAAEKLKGFFYLPETVVEKWKYEDDATYRTSTLSYTYNSVGNVVKCDYIGSSDYTYSNEYTYDSDGNVVSGGDLFYNDDPYGTYLFTYENGKLTKLVAQNKGKTTTTYKYNDKGLLVEENCKNDTYNTVSKKEYTYTYYSNGTVKTKSYDSDELVSFVEHYDENGLLTSVVFLPENATLQITQGSHGFEKIEGNVYDEEESVEITYTYDGNGALTKLAAKSFEDGELYSVHEYSFVNSRLFYSANPNVIARADVITYQDVWVALEIMY